MKIILLAPTFLFLSWTANASLLERVQELPQECSKMVQNATAKDAPARLYKILDLKKEALTIYYQVEREKGSAENLKAVRQYAMKAYLLCHQAENSFWVK